MSRKPCKCCDNDQPGVKTSSNGRGYNRLGGEAREWATDHGFARSEFCIPVRDGKRFKGPEWMRVKCGDGRMGFTTRRKNQSEVKIEKGLDEQDKRKRLTLVNSRSARATSSRRARRVDGSRVILVSCASIEKAQRDPIVVAQKKKEYKKTKRALNRNNKARHGHRLAMRMVA